MPTVPTYDQPQVQEQAVQPARFGVDTSLADFGGGDSTQKVVEGADRLAQASADVIDSHRLMADQMYASNLRGQLTNLKDNLIYNPDTGLQTMKGTNALAAPDVIDKAWQDQTAEIEKTATNDRQRAIFNKLKEKQFQLLNHAVQTHVFSEGQLADKAQNEANISIAKNSAVQNYQDPQSVVTSVQTISHDLDLYGARNGWSADQLANEKTKALSNMHHDVIERMVNNGDDMLAQNQFDHYKDQMTGDDVKATEQNLITGSTKAESQRLTYNILAKTSDETTAMAQLRDMPGVNQKVIDATRDRLKDEFNLREQARRQRQEQASDFGAQVIYNGGTPDQIPDSIKNQMTPAGRKGIDDLWRYKSQGIEPVTNWSKYSDLLEMAANPELQDKLKKTDPMSFRGDLDNAKFAEVVKIRTALIKGDATAEGKIGEVRTNQKVIQDSFEDAKITYPPKTKDDKQKLAQFSQQYFDSLNQFEQTKGGKATDQEKQQVADKLLVPVATKNGWFGSSWGNGAKPIFQVGVSDIPPEEKQKIDAYLISRGIQPTDKMRAQQYQLKLNAMQNGK